MTEKPTTVEQFVQILREHKGVRICDFNEDTWEYFDLWRDALLNNSAFDLLLTTDKCLLRYNSLLKLFGPEINADLQQFFDDNKSDLPKE